MPSRQLVLSEKLLRKGIIDVMDTAYLVSIAFRTCIFLMTGHTSNTGIFEIANSKIPIPGSPPIPDRT